MKKKTFKYFRYLKQIKPLIINLNTFMVQTKYSDYKGWTLKEDKNLYTVMTEYLVTNLVKYAIIGFSINFMLYGLKLKNVSFVHMITFAIAYWLLTTLLLMIRTGER